MCELVPCVYNSDSLNWQMFMNQCVNFTSVMLEILKTVGWIKNRDKNFRWVFPRSGTLWT